MFKHEDLPIIDKEKSVIDAIVIMSEKSLGVALICDKNNSLIGIFTDGDLRRFFAKKKNPYTSLIKDYMSLEPISVNIDNSILESIDLLNSRKINVLPILDKDKKLVGLVRLLDLIKYKVTYEQY
jgi:arabinose-5-phosphate isomerase